MHSEETTSMPTDIRDHHVETTIPLPGSNELRLASWSLAALSPPVSSVSPNGRGGDSDPNQARCGNPRLSLVGTVTGSAASQDFRLNIRRPKSHLSSAHQHDDKTLDQKKRPPIMNTSLSTSSFSLPPSCSPKKGVAREVVMILPNPSAEAKSSGNPVEQKQRNLNTMNSQGVMSNVSMVNTVHINGKRNDVPRHFSYKEGNLKPVSPPSSYSTRLATAPSSTISPSALLNRIDSSSVTERFNAITADIDNKRHERCRPQKDGRKRKLDEGATECHSLNDSRRHTLSPAIVAGGDHPLSHGKRDNVPMDLRNKRMRATDCLLFAATLLEEKQSIDACSPDSLPDPMITFERSNEEDAKVPVRVSSLMGRSHAPGTVTTANGSAVNHAIAAKKILRPPSVLLPCPAREYHFGLNVDVASLGNGDTADAATDDSPAPDIREASVERETMSLTLNDGRQVAEPTELLTKPRDADVLCGRGGKVNKHKGNIVYRKVVDYNKNYYQSVHKKHRILVSQSIVQSIINYGGRFLIMGPHGTKTWIPIGFKRAVQKTSQALRERPSPGGVDNDDGFGENEEEPEG